MKHLRLFESNEEYIPVFATQDDDDHWYIIPNEESEEFNSLLDNMIESDYEDYDLIEKFEDKFGKYKTGGDLNNIQLYIRK